MMKLIDDKLIDIARAKYTDWTLFLDRDGVINKKIDNNYVKNWESFEFLPGVYEALEIFSRVFERIIIVTNQRGVGFGLMSKNTLDDIHLKMTKKIIENGGRIDSVFICTETDDSSICRKPNVGMAIQAKLRYPEIDFLKSIMIGDSNSDVLFGRKLGMVVFKVDNNSPSKNLNDTLKYIINYDD
jgi:D-glycero-D-manno-heptose 1,7-bisphosphate phosphatase